ncbi:hypothetical protein CDAR_436861 [Caerostris darwini]|uniref:Uncharacterized protein n=1 Tax=Caerostris darwini TaxID=1538125 RepID=A0AAV4TBJ8_9ARAC|nr:hypothetical protein CDAR_436861 [Caerostris darwini]
MQKLSIIDRVEDSGSVGGMGSGPKVFCMKLKKGTRALMGRNEESQTHLFFALTLPPHQNPFHWLTFSENDPHKANHHRTKKRLPSTRGENQFSANSPSSDLNSDGIH